MRWFDRLCFGLGAISGGRLLWLVGTDVILLVVELVALGLVLGLLLVLPFLLTRVCLSRVTQLWLDPLHPEAVGAVRRTALACTAVTIVAGLVFADWCYARMLACQMDPRMEFSAALWGLACFVPIGSLVGALAASSDSFRGAATAGPDLGFHRW